jgi:hypothetical protein
MVFNFHFQQYFSYIVVVILLVEKTRENHWPVASHWKTLLHNVVSSTPHHDRGSKSR